MSFTPARPAAAGPALTVAAGLGPYFVWEQAAWGRGAGEGGPEGAGWRPLTDLLDGDVVAERVDVARRALVTMFGLAEDVVPVRVVASVTFLGIAARLLSPLLGAAVAGGALPIAGPGELWWRPVAGGPLPIACGELPAAPWAGDEGAAGLFVETAVDGLVRPVLETFRRRFALSPQVLWGNVTSALAGAAAMSAEHRDPAGAVVEACLRRPPLAGTGTLVRPDPANQRRFLVRDNCCLYYRIPGGGTCGDCVLTPAADRRRQWRAALT